MINKSFSEIEKAKRYVEVFKKVAVTLCAILAVIMLIAGIILCVYDGAAGVSYIIYSVILCGFGIFMVYFTNAISNVFVDGMDDIKSSAILIEQIAKGNSGKNNEQNVNVFPKFFESCINFYLYYVEKGAYLSASTVEEQSLRVVKDIFSAIKFNSEEEAKRFADYKRIEIGEKWQIVKKNLIIPIV